MKVAIVEDDVLLRENLNLLLSGEKGISVVGVYGNAEQALGGLREVKPDILLAKRVG